MPEKKYPLGIYKQQYVKSYIEFIAAIAFWSKMCDGKVGNEPDGLLDIINFAVDIITIIEELTKRK